MNDELATHLEPLTELTRLHLEKTAITDRALGSFSRMHRLEYLNLYGTHVTNKGLPALAQLPALKKLFLWETEVTREGEAGFVTAHPQIKVIGFPEPTAPPEPIEAPRPATKMPAKTPKAEAAKPL